VVKFIGMGKELSYAVSVARTKYLAIVRETLNSDQGFIDPETAAYREGRLRLPGPYLVSGDIDILVDPDSIMEIMNLLTGQAPTTPTGPLRTYVFKPSLPMQPATLEVCPELPATGTSKARQITGAVFKSARFEAPARELVTCTLGLHGAKDKLINAGTPTFSTKRPLVFYDGSVAQGAPLAKIANVEAFRLTYETDVPDDTHVLGSRFLTAIRPGGVTVTGDMDLAFDNWSMAKWFWGGAAVSVPGYAVTPFSLQLRCKSTDSVAADSFCEFSIRMKKVYFNTWNANIDRRDRIVQGADFQAIYDSSMAAAIMFTVKTDRSTVWK